MAAYLLRRILQSLLLVPVVVFFAFSIVSLAPGDTAAVLAGEMADPQYVEVLRKSLGLDRPFWEQLIHYMGRVARADLGYSFAYREDVARLILGRMPATLLLMVSGLSFAAVVGLVLGSVAAFKRNTRVDYLTTALSLAGFSLPAFWIGMMSIVLFSVVLGWLPIGGIRSLRYEMGFWESLGDLGRHLVLPMLTIGLRQMAITARVVRAALLEEMGSDYVRTARSKGLGEYRVLVGHVLRNALLPVLTIWGLQFGTMMSGAVLTETVFSWPGIGRLMFEALSYRDYPVLIGALISTSVLVAVLNIVTDLLYMISDPRIRYA